MSAVLPTLEVLPRDLSAYRQGNTGIDYVHRTQPGPIPGLTSIEDVANDALTDIDQSSVIPLYWVFALAAFVLLRREIK